MTRALEPSGTTEPSGIEPANARNEYGAERFPCVDRDPGWEVRLGGLEGSLMLGLATRSCRDDAAWLAAQPGSKLPHHRRLHRAAKQPWPGLDQVTVSRD
ncbi:hypothetical protein GCM10009872_62950 [Actinopolymorpha rutila]